MFHLSTHVDIRPALRTLEGHRSQTRFAVAVALTKTAQDAQTGVQRQSQSKFAVTRTWWQKQQPTGIRVRSATKGSWVAYVYSGPKAHWAELQEEGGSKGARSGARVVVPTYKQAAGKPLKQGGFGGRTRRWRSRSRGTSAFDAAMEIVKRTQRTGSARQWLARTGRQLPRSGRAVVGSARYPVAWTKEEADGTVLLFMRKTKRAKPTLEFVLDPRVRVRRRWGFEKRVVREALRTFGRNFEAAAAMAVRSRR